MVDLADAGEEPSPHLLLNYATDLALAGRHAEAVPTYDAWLDHPETVDYPSKMRADVEGRQARARGLDDADTRSAPGATPGHRNLFAVPLARVP